MTYTYYHTVLKGTTPPKASAFIARNDEVAPAATTDALPVLPEDNQETQPAIGAHFAPESGASSKSCAPTLVVDIEEEPSYDFVFEPALKKSAEAAFAQEVFETQKTGELPLISPDTLAKYPKWIIGYSDITSLHSAQVRAGNMSLHANMCGNLADKEADPKIQGYLRDILRGKLPTYRVPAHPFNQPGTAQGILLGGNMSVFSVNFSGSAQWDFLDRDYIAQRDIILFFEDVGETMPRVASMLTQLRLKGVLHRVKGIMVGRFTDYKPQNGFTDMNDMLHQMLDSYDLDIPICYDFPASHDEAWNYPLIEGHPVTLDVAPTGVTLRFD